MQVNNFNTYGTKYTQHMAKYNAKKSEQQKKMEELLTGVSEDNDKNDASSTNEVSSGIALSVDAASTKTTELSETAQNYLAQLKEKYSDMDFIIADYSSDEEASELLSNGTGEINVLIDPETLEKMAADEDVRAEYEGYIDTAAQQLSDMKENLTKELGEDLAGSIKSLGFSVDGGKISYTAVIEGILSDSAERTENTKEFIEASSVTDLADKISEKLKEKQEAAEEDQDEESEEAEVFVRRNGHFKTEYQVYDTETLVEMLKSQSSTSSSIFDYINNSNDNNQSNSIFDYINNSDDNSTKTTDSIMDLFA